MTVPALSPFSFLTWTFRKSGPRNAEDPDIIDDAERRKIVREMIAAGACNSEYGVQMLMSMYPDQF